AANAARDEVRSARVFALHEDAVTAENGRRAVTLGHLPVFEIDFGIDTQAADDPRNGIPIHFHQAALRTIFGDCRVRYCCHESKLLVKRSATVFSEGTWPVSGSEPGTGMPPFWFFIDRVIGDATERTDRRSV